MPDILADFESARKRASRLKLVKRLGERRFIF
jgi:hypothetical protein